MDMGNVEKVIYYFVKRFPQKLGRTMLIKAIYLLDCEWYRSFGKTYTGLQYHRDNNGPFDTAFYEAKKSLSVQGIISETLYYHPGGYGYEYEIMSDSNELENEMNPIAMEIADEIVDKLSNKGLHDFLELAYNTEPMLAIQEEEQREGHKLIGRQLDMSKLQRSPEPLFSFDEIKDVAKKLNLEERGSGEDYNKTVLREMAELEVYRERVAKACQMIGKD